MANELQVCPYNVFHRVAKGRLQVHLTKCARNYRDAKKKTCPFDSTHIVDENEYDTHIEQCPSKASVIQYKYIDPEEAAVNVLPIDNVLAGVAEENWDDDTDVKSYRPFENIAERPVVFQVPGVSKSQRKVHRLNERRRYNQVINNISKENISDNQQDSNEKVNASSNEYSDHLSASAENLVEYYDQDSINSNEMNAGANQLMEKKQNNGSSLSTELNANKDDIENLSKNIQNVRIRENNKNNNEGEWHVVRSKRSRKKQSRW